jgi:hypothetical protein
MEGLAHLWLDSNYTLAALLAPYSGVGTKDSGPDHLDTMDDPMNHSFSFLNSLSFSFPSPYSCSLP